MKVPLLHSTATFCAMEVMEADGSSIIITNQEGYKSEGKYIYYLVLVSVHLANILSYVVK